MSPAASLPPAVESPLPPAKLACPSPPTLEHVPANARLFYDPGDAGLVWGFGLGAFSFLGPQTASVPTAVSDEHPPGFRVRGPLLSPLSLLHPPGPWVIEFSAAELPASQQVAGPFEVGPDADTASPRWAGLVSPPAESEGDPTVRVTLADVEDESPLFLDVFLERTALGTTGRPTTLPTMGRPRHQVEWWSRIPLAASYGSVPTTLLGGYCDAQLPTDTHVGDIYRLTLQLVDMAGNVSVPYSYDLVITW